LQLIAQSEIWAPVAVKGPGDGVVGSAAGATPASDLQPQRRGPASARCASWLNRIEAQFEALRYFALDGTDHRSHEEQNHMIRRYIAWRNRNAKDKALSEVITRANVA